MRVGCGSADRKLRRSVREGTAQHIKSGVFLQWVPTQMVKNINFLFFVGHCLVAKKRSCICDLSGSKHRFVKTELGHVLLKSVIKERIHAFHTAQTVVHTPSDARLGQRSYRLRF